MTINSFIEVCTKFYYGPPGGVNLSNDSNGAGSINAAIREQGAKKSKGTERKR